MHHWRQQLNPARLHDKKDWDALGNRSLSSLLSSKGTLAFPEPGEVELSVIVVLYNKAHLSLLALMAILDTVDVPFELIVVDNASSDATGEVLRRCVGAKIISNTSNLGFGEACMQGSGIATGRFLLFLNNDALLTPGAIRSALANFQNSSVGAVGGKILLANGQLQEAGSIIWSDGSALGYGRGENPNAPQYLFRRPVDYCSGAFLFTPRALFEQLGGFDPVYAPAYYEDTDYCMKVWDAGFEVLYEPLAIVHHYESASSGNNEAAQPRMAQKQRIFAARWRHRLTAHLRPALENVLRARIAARSQGLRILYIDDRVPHQKLGAGFPRASDILAEMVRQKHHVACVPFNFPVEDLSAEYANINHAMEIVTMSPDDIGLYRGYVSAADLIWISRPHNMSGLIDRLIEYGDTNAKLVFDAEAIFSERESLKIQLTGRSLPPAIMESRMQREIALAAAAHEVVVVADREKKLFEAAGIRNVHVLGHALEARPGLQPFRHRPYFLFVGAMHGHDNPNADSMHYFCREVWPEVRMRTAAELMIAGFGTESLRSYVTGDGIRILGSVDHLDDLYGNARVVIIPTRYAAGIPYKAHEAAARGVPMVVSSLIGMQLGWEHGRDILIAQTPEQYVDFCCALFEDEDLWETLRANLLTRIVCEFTRQSFSETLAQILGSINDPNPTLTPSASGPAASDDLPLSRESHARVLV